uniref:Uncharacterized protein n=1 Tax=Anguilla anguilla TaxID=7936 RepID=A0A0E9V1E5_ANGAN
MPLQRSGRY